MRAGIAAVRYQTFPHFVRIHRVATFWHHWYSTGIVGVGSKQLTQAGKQLPTGILELHKIGQLVIRRLEVARILCSTGVYQVARVRALVSGYCGDPCGKSSSWFMRSAKGRGYSPLSACRSQLRMAMLLSATFSSKMLPSVRYCDSALVAVATACDQTVRCFLLHFVVHLCFSI